LAQDAHRRLVVQDLPLGGRVHVQKSPMPHMLCLSAGTASAPVPLREADVAVPTNDHMIQHGNPADLAHLA